MSDTRTAIWAIGLSKIFEGRAVLRGIDVGLKEGEIVAVTGANGAGKTTLLGCLAATVRPDSGEVRWYGNLAGRNPVDRRLIGMVAHESRLYPQLTIRENLMFAARMCGVSQPRQQTEQLLRSAGIEQFADRMPRYLSRGTRQRASVIRALVHDPRIILLDEPFASLDVCGCQWLNELMNELRQRGRSICFVTHDLAKSRLLADRVLSLRSGRLTESVSPSPHAGKEPASRCAA